MPSLSHSPLASYNPKKILMKIELCTILYIFAFLAILIILCQKKADLARTFPLVGLICAFSKFKIGIILGVKI